MVNSSASSVLVLMPMVITCILAYAQPAGGQSLEWNSSYISSSDYFAQTNWSPQIVTQDSVLTRLSVEITGLPLANKPAGDVSVFISRPELPYYYPFISGGYSELFSAHLNRNAENDSWSWEIVPDVFIPSGSEISCCGAIWSTDGVFPQSFGEFSCAVTLNESDGITSMLSLRFPYFDQFVKPVNGTNGETGQSPWVGYKSSSDFPLKVNSAAFFISFPQSVEYGLHMCVYWLKNGMIHDTKCIPFQYKAPDSNYDGYQELLDINWDIPPGDEIYAQCTYYGDGGPTGDCAAYVFAEIPEDKKDYRGVFTNYDHIEPSKAHDYCYDEFNSRNFTHPHFYDNASERCMELLMIYYPIEVNLSSDKYYGAIGESLHLTAQHRRGLNPQYRFFYYDGVDFSIIRDWDEEENATAQIINQGINQYGVHMRDGDAGDFVEQDWISVDGTEPLCDDMDGDGYGVGPSCLGPDCNDTNPNINQTISCLYNGSLCGQFNLCVLACPSAPAEICGNHIDEDCNGWDLHCADTDEDGCIVMGELMDFIDRWKLSSVDVPMPQLMEAVDLWKAGQNTTE